MGSKRPGARGPGGEARPAQGLVYVYAVIEAGSPAHELLRAGLIDGETLFPIERGGLVAAASRVPAEQFSTEAIDALAGDLESLAPFALRHEEAIRALRPAAEALVPLGFGAVYRATEGVAAFLDERGAELRGTLERVRNREEWGVKVWRDTARFRQAVEAASELLRQIAGEVRSATPGRAYLLRKSRERRVQDEVERESGVAAAEILRRLSDRAAAARRDPLPAEATAGPRALILKAAFLVDREAAGPFADGCAEVARAESARGLHLEISGPWAPYSFVGTSR